MTPERIQAARELRAAGMSWRAMAALFGVSMSTVIYHVKPGCKEAQAKRVAAWSQANPDRIREIRRVATMRQHARYEAKETGEPVRNIYARWKILCRHDFKGLK